MNGVDDCASGRDDFDWIHQTGAGRHIAPDQTAKYIRHRGNGYSFDGVYGADDLGSAAGEINARSLAFDCDKDANRNLRIADAVIVERVFSFITAIGNRS